VSVNFYLSMWTISCSQLFGDVCSSKSLLVEIEKEKNSRTPHRHTSTHALSHTTHMHTRHAHAHTAHTPHAMHRHSTHTHSSLSTSHAQHTAYREKVRAKEGNPFKLSFFGAGVVVSAKHISSAPKGGPAPRWSCKLVELLLQSWFGGAGALPNTP
jgi:hypothetical protein